MAPQHMKNNLHPLHRWLRNKILLKRRCASSYRRRQNQLQSHHQLYRQTIHWHQPRLALHSISSLRWPQHQVFFDRDWTKFGHLMIKNLSMPPTPGPHQSMSRKLPSGLRPPIPHLSVTTNGNKPSTPLLAPSSITQKSTHASKLHSTKSLPGNQNRHKKQWNIQYDDYLATHPEGTLRFYASNTTLTLDSESA